MKIVRKISNMLIKNIIGSFYYIISTLTLAITKSERKCPVLGRFYHFKVN